MTEEEIQEYVDIHNQLVSTLFMLDGKEVVPVTNIPSFNAFMKNQARRRLARDEINGYLVSTVFLPVNHEWCEDAAPLFFETMVFKVGDHDDLFCERYTTWDEAIQGHEHVVNLVKDGYFDEEDFCLRIERELVKKNDE